ncbi:sulfotransferase [Streptomyces blastmyceticus]|uniref:Sulfotransferase n=1 Tax=Streptomyces blastmyceticus TaxID=68180 RepID=A0ABN0WHZ6_9ACTN
MRKLTFVVGTGRSGSSALSRVLNAHPGVLSLNEFLASLGSGALPEGALTGEEFRRLLVEPNPVFETMNRSGMPLPEFLYVKRPGRYATGTTGIPALSLMVLPHLTDDPDGLLDGIEAQVATWPARTAAAHHEALFDLLAARFGRTAVVERSGYSVQWVPRLRAAFPYARFVHLFRDGPDCALSMSRHVGYRTIFLFRRIQELTGVKDFTELTEADVRSLPPDLAGVLGERIDPALVWDRELPVEEFGALWSELVARGAGHLAGVPAPQRATLAYEDLLDRPEEELSRLARFVGVEPLPEWLDAGRALLDGSRRGASRRLPPGRLAALRESCEPGTRALEAYRQRYQVS